MDKGKLLMIIIIVLLVAVLGTIVGVAIYAMSWIQNMANNPDSGDGTRAPAQIHLTPEDIGKISAGDSFTTNLSAPDGGESKHIAKIGVLIGYDKTQGKLSDELAAKLTAELDYIRTVVLSCIRNSTFEDLSQKDGSATLTGAILERLQDDFNTNMIVDVYISEWVLQ
jgi:flagellar basal body-associated protein FliL